MIILKELFESYKEKIIGAIPYSEVEHVGASSYPGVETKGDLDIQIRVEKEDFQNTVSILSEIFTSRYHDLWTDEFALFGDPVQEIKIDIMLTAKESAYDSFYKFRDAMIDNPPLRKRYIDLKKKYPDFLSDEYRIAKDIFFREAEKELGLKPRPLSLGVFTKKKDN